MAEFATLAQTVTVAVIVAFCLLYSAWRLTSARFHLRLIDLLGGLIGGPAPRWLGSWRNSVLNKLSAGGCGTCSSNVKPRQPRPGPESKT